jgi:type II secretory pathway pseudopilin PulG
VAGAGFTLVELLIAVAASTVVLAGLAAMLVSGVRASRQAEEAQSLKDEWNLAATFMQTEIGNADTITTAVGGTYECGGAAPANPLVLNGPSNGAAPAWRVIYGVRALSNATWIGPNVLVRCGRPYLATAPIPLDPLFGELDSATAPVESVVLDRLPTLASFTPTLAATDGSSLARDVNVTLGLQTLLGAAYQNQFRARVGVNPAYDLLDYDEAATGVTCTDNTLCQTTLRPQTCLAESPSNCFTVFEYRASGTGGTITPNVSGVPADRRIELAVYFPGPRANYTIQRSSGTSTDAVRTCIITSCFVGTSATTGTQILPPASKPFAAIILSFTDQQIRV